MSHIDRPFAARRAARIARLREELDTTDTLRRLRAVTSSASFLVNSNSPDPLVPLVKLLHDPDRDATEEEALSAVEIYLDEMLINRAHRRARTPMTYLIAFAASPAQETEEYDLQFAIDHGETVQDWGRRYLRDPEGTEW